MPCQCQVSGPQQQPLAVTHFGSNNNDISFSVMAHNITAVAFISRTPTALITGCSLPDLDLLKRSMNQAMQISSSETSIASCKAMGTWDASAAATRDGQSLTCEQWRSVASGKSSNPKISLPPGIEIRISVQAGPSADISSVLQQLQDLQDSPKMLGMGRICVEDASSISVSSLTQVKVRVVAQEGNWTSTDAGLDLLPTLARDPEKAGGESHTHLTGLDGLTTVHTKMHSLSHVLSSSTVPSSTKEHHVTRT